MIVRTSSLATAAVNFLSVSTYLALVASTVQSSTNESMKALVSTGASPFGPSHGKWNFEMVEKPIPRPSKGEVLIRVHAGSINPVDFKIAEFRSGPLGRDYSGTVVSVGGGCSHLSIGQEVYGAADAMFAQYASVSCDRLGIRASSSVMALADYATLPIGAGTSIEALWKAGAPWAPSRNLTVVVTSGGGGTGVFALQQARALGASRVITAARAEHAPLLRSLGATNVVDYTAHSLWDVLPPDSVDVVYDNYGAPGTADLAMRSLRAGGVFIFLPGKNGKLSENPKPGVRQIDYGLFSSAGSTYVELSRMVEAGQMKAVVQQWYGLEQVAEAFTVCAEGHVVGKLGVNVDNAL